MINPDNLAPILVACTSLAWPVFAILCMFLFNTEIRQLLRRLQTAKLPGGTEATFKYGDAPSDKSSQRPLTEERAKEASATDRTLQAQIKWNKTGNLYWLGHDLMWTIDAALRDAPREIIIYGLRQSLHHAHSLGLINTPIESRLARLKANADASLQHDWTSEKRTQLASELAALRDEIGDLISGHQPDFVGKATE